MKNILFLILAFFMSMNGFASCWPFDNSSCPTTDCPLGSFMGDDGRCYSCNEEKSIDINCIGQETAKKACLNRVVKECSNNLLFIKCPNGSKRKEGSICYKDGEFHAYSCSY